MKNRIILIIISLIMILIISCQKSSHLKKGLSDQDISNIHSFFELHKQNALSSDWVADALLYTKDAVRLPPGGDPIKGRITIQESLEAIDTILAFTPEIIELDGYGHIAYVWVKYSFTSIAVGSSEPIVSSGKSLMILKKQHDNSWKFHRVMWN